MKLTIPIAGTTKHTVMCAEALLNDPRFTIPWILTPEPKEIGRKKVLTKNPLHQFAEKNNIPVILIKKKIDEEVKQRILSINVEEHTKNTEHRTKNPQPTTHNLQPTFLLVVDFGYIIPNWLLELPSIAPVNIHPSELPKYRGSSPGQFVLLFGEKTSAVTVIKMNNSVDQGDIIHQEKFKILSTWTSNDYYQFAFELIAKKLPNILAKQPLDFTPQPIESPSPIARRLNRDDGFVSWKLVKQLQSAKSVTAVDPETSTLLNQVFSSNSDWGKTIKRAINAFSPWPGIWTTVQTPKGKKRMKILSVKTQSFATLQLDLVQFEGLQPTSWNEVKNQIL